MGYRLELSVVGGFFVRCMLWLPPLLAVWYLAGDYLVRPAAWLSGQVMWWAFPEWTLGTELQANGKLVLRTALQLPAHVGGGGDLSTHTQLLKFSHGLPLFAALLLSTKATGVWWKLPLAFLVLMPVQAFGVCSEWLVNIAVHAGGYTQGQTGFGPVAVNAFAIAKQLGYLILPTLAPLLLWAFFEQKFIRTIVLDGALDGAVRNR